MQKVNWYKTEYKSNRERLECPSVIFIIITRLILLCNLNVIFSNMNMKIYVLHFSSVFYDITVHISSSSLQKNKSFELKKLNTLFNTLICDRRLFPQITIVVIK